MMVSGENTCLTDDKDYDYKQAGSKPPSSTVGSKLLNLKDFKGGFFIWMSSVAQ